MILELRNVNSTLTTKDAKAKLSELTQKVLIYMLQSKLRNLYATMYLIIVIHLFNGIYLLQYLLF